MELVEGRSLDAFLRESGKRPPEAVADLAAQLARTLSVAHATGIIHRDIKPSNLVLTADGKLRLLDFGLSHMVGMQSISAPGVLLGTIPYMSPEQLLGESIDPRTDIFSASVVFYELLSGRRPFPGERFETVSHAILNVTPPRLSRLGVEVPEPFERVVFKGLSKHPGDRYQSAAELLHDWEILCEEPGRGGSGPLLATDEVLVARDRTSYAGYVGREGELRRAERVLEGLKTRGGRIVIIGGEAGTGKTRFVEELRGRAARGGCETLESRCMEGRGTRAYQVWADLFERWFEREGSTTPDEIHATLEGMGLGLRTAILAPFFRHSRAPHAEQPAGDGLPEVANARGLWETLTELVRAIARERPLFLFLEDLQRADPLSLDYLAYLASELNGSPVVIVGALRTNEAREEAAGGRLANVLAEIRRHDRLVELTMGRLAAHEVREIVRSRFPAMEGTDELARRIHDESEGNALHVIETLKLLEAERVIDERDGRHVVTRSLRTLPIPEKVVDLIRQRLDPIDADDRELLDAAAVAGGSFPAKALATCLERTQLDVLRRLRRIENRYGVVTSTEGGFRFAQPKIREYLIEGMPAVLRVELHRTIARALASLYADDDRRAGEIAQHFLDGEEPIEAVPFLERAGDRSFRVFANDAALGAYEGARAILDEQASGDRLLDRARLGRKTSAVEQRVGRFEEAILSASVAVKLAHRARGERELAETQLALAEAQSNHGHEARALASVEKAERAFVTARDEEGLARALDRRGTVLQRRGDLEESLSAYRDGLAIRERLGLDDAVARSHYRIGSCLKRMRRYAESIAELERAREALEASGDRITAASTSGEIGSVHFFSGDYNAAATEYARCLEVMRAAGERRRLAIALSNAANAELFLGNLNRALALYRECLAIRLEIGDRGGIGKVQANLVVVFRYQSRYRDGILAAHDGLELNRELADRRYFAAASRHAGWIRYELGELDRARTHFEDTRRIHYELDDTLGAATAELQIGHVHLATGSLEGLDAAIARAREVAGSEFWPDIRWEALLLRALRFGAEGRAEEAAEHASRAFEAVERSGDFYSRAQTETMALALAARAGGRAAARARDLFPDALTTVLRARLRGLELLLRSAHATLLARDSVESGIAEMRLALAAADPIMEDVPESRLGGWAIRSGYADALDRLATWAREASDERAREDVRRRLVRLDADGGTE